MPDPRWQRIQELAEAGESIPLSERESWIAARESDAAIRLEALDLIDALGEESSAAGRSPEKPERPLPARIGAYSISAVLGSGGRSVVYRGTRETEGAVQHAAVKVLQDSLVSAADLARFEREQRILAGLAHPAIARFLDAGRDANGRPYLAMEWVDGDPVDEYCRREAIPVRRRVALIAEAADALQAAHGSLVIHLDLKPSNILVDRSGRLKLVDFGTAKLLDDSNDSTTTRQFTPRYASPEQLRGEPVSTASDIYSLGLTLYELVAGEWPFEGRSSLAALAERASGAVTVRGIPKLGDLDAIVRKALETDPMRRYRSAAEFGDDLRAYLDRRPVVARPPTVAYRLNRFVARNRGAVSAALVLAIALAASGGFAWWQREERLREARRAEQTANFLQWMLQTSAAPAGGRTNATVLDMIERGNRRIEEGLGPPGEVAAQLQSTFAYVARESGREDVAEPIARRAVERADASRDPQTRIGARRALAEILLRLGRCEDAVALYREADSTLARDGRNLRPLARASYLAARATAKSRCEAKPAEAVAILEEAIAVSESARREEAPLAVPILRAAMYNQLASELARMRRLDEARRAAGRGLSLAESHPDGRSLRVSLLRTRSQVETAAQNPRAALADLEQAAKLAPGAVTAFEELRIHAIAGAKYAELGQRETAIAKARDTVRAAQTRASEIGPSRWMLYADSAEVFARAKSCPESFAAYKEADALTGGQYPRDWRGNRLYFEAECLAATDPARAAERANQALAVYGDLLPADHPRRLRLNELAAR
ncbi:MAG: protein kinase [Bryobacteraceae bacterium]|nr:protein kinase [Bryobacteraceae bacterium]